MLHHGSNVNIKENSEENEAENGDGEEVVGNRLYQEGQRVLDLCLCDFSEYSGTPTRDRNENAHIRGDDVDDLSVFLGGHSVELADGLHDTAIRQRVEIVVHEEKDANSISDDLRDASGVDVLCDKPSERLGSSGLVDDLDKTSHKHNKDDQLGVFLENLGQKAVKQGEELHGGGVGEDAIRYETKNVAAQNREKDLFCGYSEDEGEERRKNRVESDRSLSDHGNGYGKKSEKDISKRKYGKWQRKSSLFL